MNIDNELQKIKDYLKDKITISVDIEPNYDFGNKVSALCFYMDNGKMKKAEYSFYIKYDENKDNYANALYFLHCNFSYGDGGSGYGIGYNSIQDFINTDMVKELIKNYGKDKQNEKLEFNYTEEDIELEEESEEDTNYNELTIFDLDNDTQNNQLSLFDEIEETKQNDPVEELLSYGVDKYYETWLKGETFGVIKKNISNVPKYNEYYEKLRNYLKNKLPNGTYDNTDYKAKPTFITDSEDIITIKGNRQQCPIYCYKMYENNFE